LHSISLGLANQFVKITTPLHPSLALTRTSVKFGCTYLICNLQTILGNTGCELVRCQLTLTYDYSLMDEVPISLPPLLFY
jgi:hypothetical protein